MTNKVIVIPEEVRCGGNIVSPHESSDYLLYKCTLVESTDTIGGETRTVYTLEYDATTFLLTVSASRVLPGEEVTVSVLLTDENGDPVEGASVALYKVT